MPLSLGILQFIWTNSYADKLKCNFLVYIMGHFTDYFGITEVGGKNVHIVIWEDFIEEIVFVQRIIPCP